MAGALDIGLLEYFSIIFPALLIFVIVYALFSKLKLLGENKSLNAIAAIAIAFIVIMSRDITKIINVIAPWFVVLFIFIILLLIIYKMLGASDENLSNFITTHTMTQWMIFIIGIIIVIAGIASVYGQRLSPLTTGESNGTAVSSTSTTGSTFGESVGKTLFHPKIIGTLFIFLVAAFAIGLLSMEAPKV